MKTCRRCNKKLALHNESGYCKVHAYQGEKEKLRRKDVNTAKSLNRANFLRGQEARQNEALDRFYADRAKKPFLKPVVGVLQGNVTQGHHADWRRPVNYSGAR